MVIKVSSSREIEALIAGLRSMSVPTREAAIARLTVLGARAVDRLIRLAHSDATPTARAAALRTLEAIADPHALDAAVDAMEDTEPAVALAAVSTARVFLRGPRGAVVVDGLMKAALDDHRDEAVRTAAVRAMGDLDRKTIAPLLEALAADPSADVRAQVALAASAQPARRVGPLQALADAADRGLPDDPEMLLGALARPNAAIELPQLLRLVERIGEREAAEPLPRRPEWVRARGAAHVALANRGSRIALYDLRETLEQSAAPLPVEFLAALSTVGDASCLQAIAAAYARTSGHAKHDWWRDHLADAFRAIVAREGLTRRHAVIKKLEKRWKNAVDQMWAAPARKVRR